MDNFRSQRFYYHIEYHANSSTTIDCYVQPVGSNYQWYSLDRNISSERGGTGFNEVSPYEYGVVGVGKDFTEKRGLTCWFDKSSEGSVSKEHRVCSNIKYIGDSVAGNSSAHSSWVTDAQRFHIHNS